MELEESSSNPARCLRCGYILNGLPEPRCPECGLEFLPEDPSTYTTRLPFVRWQFWLPGLSLAVGAGLITYVILLATVGYGWGVTIAAPFCVGCIIGYACRVRTFLIVLLAISASLAIIIGMFSLSLVGIYCGLILAGVAFGPVIIGSLFGMALRRHLKNNRFSQRDWLPMLLVWLTPFFWAALEGRHVYPNETIETSVIIPTSVAAAWEGVMFYEEVHHEPPLLLRWLLPRPLYTSGGTQHVGDRKVCVYSKGRLVKKITRRDEGKLLAFDVIEQEKIETRSIRLTGGQFRFEAVGPAETRVTLATEYQPLLGPRFAWRWAETWATHTLHRHVLEGMRMKARENATREMKMMAVSK